jgi:hypothetical protein
MISLADISINMEGYARYPLVKAHGKVLAAKMLLKIF